MGDRRKCQTYTASPAEPEGLPVMLEACFILPFSTLMQKDPTRYPTFTFGHGRRSRN
jgi:hypothetical protein